MELKITSRWCLPTQLHNPLHLGLVVSSPMATHDTISLVLKPICLGCFSYCNVLPTIETYTDFAPHGVYRTEITKYGVRRPGL